MLYVTGPTPCIIETENIHGYLEIDFVVMENIRDYSTQYVSSEIISWYSQRVTATVVRYNPHC